MCWRVFVCHLNYPINRNNPIPMLHVMVTAKSSCWDCLFLFHSNLLFINCVCFLGCRSTASPWRSYWGCGAHWVQILQSRAAYHLFRSITFLLWVRWFPQRWRTQAAQNVAAIRVWWTTNPYCVPKCSLQPQKAGIWTHSWARPLVPGLRPWRTK
jgi:hypothetical protein